MVLKADDTDEGSATEYGYDELAKLAYFSVAFGNAFAVAEDQASPLGKAAAFLAVCDEALDLLSLDSAQLRREFDDMDDAEWYALCQECAEYFDLADDKLELKIEKSVEIGFRMLSEIRQCVALWKDKA